MTLASYAIIAALVLILALGWWETRRKEGDE